MSVVVMPRGSLASRRRGGFAACGAALRPHGTQATDSDQEVEEAGDEVERRHLGERNPARVGGVVARRGVGSPSGVAKKSRMT